MKLNIMKLKKIIGAIVLKSKTTLWKIYCVQKNNIVEERLLDIEQHCSNDFFIIQ